MIKGHEDITNSEFESIMLPFDNNLYEFIAKYVIPDYVAFYIASVHRSNALCDASFLQHFNTAIECLFFDEDNIGKVTDEILEILKVKYSLSITDGYPMKVEKLRQ